MLEGSLVRLRAREKTDLDRVHRWINDREVTQYLLARYPLSRAAEEKWLEENADSSFQSVRLAIETKDGVHIGNIDLGPIDAEDRRGALGIMIGEKEYWGRGLGSDAIRTLLRFAFDEMNLNRVWLTAHEFNERAVACYRKCGFREEGRLRQDRYFRGRYWDTLIMGVLRDELGRIDGQGD